ncbi:MAG TPA: FAD-binding oxidoreductase [Candidatus Limnocylindrales bacterium]|nr:FAD-binding oxidoreductase [Candidatus Limnocylindrales bacterium]
MTTAAALSDPILDELRGILGDEGVLPNLSARYNRTRVPSPFPVHRWSDYVPDVVVLPRTAEQVSAVVKLANRYGIPVVPRAGGTGLADGAVPLRRGIIVDVKLMNQIHEIDLVDRTVTVGPGINMLKLNEELRKHGVIYPDDPASYPCSLVGGRIGTSGWSLIGGRYGHTRDLVISMEWVLPNGEIVQIGDGGGRKIRKSSTGFQLKHLFMGSQGSLGICTQATLELVPRPEVEFSAFFAYPDFQTAYESTGALTKSGLATLAGVVLFDEWKLRYLRRDDEAYIPQPGNVQAVVATAMYGTRDEVGPAARRLMKIGRQSGGNYLGDEISQGDWASRHDRYATPLHGRLRNGQVVPMSWHCEDASLNYSVLPQVREEWHAIADRYITEYGIFDDWGMFFYTNGAYKPWGDYLVEIDVGIWEQKLNDDNWAAWVQCKREITEVTLKYGGSITACHGSTREGDAEYVPQEMGGGFEVMKQIKRALDPNNIMNPGKNELDLAYGQDGMGGRPAARLAGEG